jgi:hypothetical protein
VLEPITVVVVSRCGSDASEPEGDGFSSQTDYEVLSITGTPLYAVGGIISGDPLGIEAHDITNTFLHKVAFGSNLFVGIISNNPLDRFLLTDFSVWTNNVQTLYLGQTVSPVPLPATVWLFGTALGFLGWMRRKQA